MDFEQTIYETFDRVERLDRDVRKSLKNSGSGTTGAIANDDIDKLKNSIKGQNNLDLTTLNKSIKGQNNLDISTLNLSVKGAGNVDLTALNENVNATCASIKGADDINLSSLNESVEAISASVKGKKDVDLTTLNDNIDAMSESIKGTDDVDLSLVKTTVDNLQKNSETGFDNLNNKINENKSSLENLDIKLDENKSSLDSLDVILNENKTSVDNLNNKLDENKTSLENLSSKIDANNTIISENIKGADNIDLTALSENIKGTDDVDLTSLNDSIKGKKDVDLSTLNESVERISVRVEGINESVEGISASVKGEKDVDLSLLHESIKGTNNVDLTTINEKLNVLTKYVGDSIGRVEFEEDPFKLDEDFVEYVPGATIFSTSDFIQYTRPYSVESSSSYCATVCGFGVYCEDVSFDVKLTLDVEMSKDSKVRLDFVDSTVDTTSNTYVDINLQQGRNLISETVENVNVSTSGNIVAVILYDTASTVNSFKVEVLGKNVVILTKPMKYKCFSKYDEVIISKVENHNAYRLNLDADKLNPADLSKSYELVKEDVRDFQEVVGTYVFDKATGKGFHCYAYADLAGYVYQKILTYDERLVNKQFTQKVMVLDNAGYNKFFKSYHICYSSNIQLAYAGNQITNVYADTFLTASNNTTASFCPIYDNFNQIDTETTRHILTCKDSTNLLYFKMSSAATKLDLGKGYNVTAYFDENSKSVVRVYMKVGDKMVRKIVNFSTTTDEEGNSTESASIVEEKIIGTYDYYFETNTDKYFVVKDDELYMFKK